MCLWYWLLILFVKNVDFLVGFTREAIPQSFPKAKIVDFSLPLVSFCIPYEYFTTTLQLLSPTHMFRYVEFIKWSRREKEKRTLFIFFFPLSVVYIAWKVEYIFLFSFVFFPFLSRILYKDDSNLGILEGPQN